MTHIRSSSPAWTWSGLVVLIGLTLCWTPAANSQYMADAAMKELRDASKPLVETTAPTFLAEYKDVSLTSSIIQVTIFYPQQVSTICLVLSTSLWTLEKGLQGASHLPYIGKAADAAAQSVKAARKSVKALKEEMDELMREANRTPLVVLNKFTLYVTRATALADGLEKGLPWYIETWQPNIDDAKKKGMKPGDTQDQNFARGIGIDVWNIKHLNAAYSLLIPPAKKFNDMAKAEMVPALDKIKAFHDELQQYEDKLHPLEKGLSEIQHIIGRKIRHGFKYPHPSFKNPLRTSTYHISISIGEILEGYGHVEHIIKHKLSSTLWKVLKVFGVGKFVKEFVSAGEREAKRDLEKIAMKALEAIPGASEIPEEASKAKEGFEQLSSFLTSTDFGNANHFAQLLSDAMKDRK